MKQPGTCTRLAPHICRVNGPCNGFPRQVEPLAPVTPTTQPQLNNIGVESAYQQTCPRCTFEFFSQGACNCICHTFPDHNQLQDALEALKFCQQKLAGVTPTPPTDPQKVIGIAREMLNAERSAVQNAEYGNERAVERHQRLADSKMEELEAALAAPDSTSGPRYDWKCLSCQSQVSTVCDFHINSRPLCNLCNGEMIPFVGEPLTEDDLKRIENSVLRAKVGGDEVEGGATPRASDNHMNGDCNCGAAPLMEQSQSKK